MHKKGKEKMRKSKSTLISTIIVVLLLSFGVIGLLNSFSFNINIPNFNFGDNNNLDSDMPETELSDVSVLSCSILSTEAAYIRGGMYSNDVFSKVNGVLDVRACDENPLSFGDYDRGAYLKFNVSHLKHYDFNNAILYFSVIDDPNTSDHTKCFDLYLVENNWNETEITANSRPNIIKGYSIETISLDKTENGYHMYSVDLTDFVNAVLQRNKNEMSILITSRISIYPVENCASIAFTEDIQPYILFNYSSDVVQNNNVIHKYNDEFVCVYCNNSCPHNVSDITVTAYKNRGELGHYETHTCSCGWSTEELFQHTILSNGTCKYCDFICEHEEYTVTKDFYSIDDQIHDCEIYCSTCGIKGTMSQIFGEDLKHVYTNGVCDVCNYEPNCEHYSVHIVFELNPANERMQHEIIEVCNYCGYRENVGKEVCNLTNGICECGRDYCDHGAFNNYVQYKSLDNGKHSGVCSICKETVYSVEDCEFITSANEEYHYCSSCGYKAEHEMSSSITRTTQSKHYITDECVYCGYSVTGGYNHRYIDGECSVCGYNCVHSSANITVSDYIDKGDYHYEIHTCTCGWSTTESAPHSLVNGICTKCGHEE